MLCHHVAASLVSSIDIPFRATSSVIFVHSLYASMASMKVSTFSSSTPENLDVQREKLPVFAPVEVLSGGGVLACSWTGVEDDAKDVRRSNMRSQISALDCWIDAMSDARVSRDSEMFSFGSCSSVCEPLRDCRFRGMVGIGITAQTR